MKRLKLILRYFNLKNLISKLDVAPGNALQRVSIFCSILGTALSVYFAWQAVVLTVKYGESSQKVEDMDKVIHELITQNQLLAQQIAADKETTRPRIKVDSVRFNRDKNFNLTFFNIFCKNYGIRRGSDIYLTAQILYNAKDSLIVGHEFEHKNRSVWIEPGESKPIFFEKKEEINDIIKGGCLLLINLRYYNEPEGHLLYKRAYQIIPIGNVLRYVGIDTDGIARIEELLVKTNKK